MEFLALSMVTSGVGPISAAVTGFMVNFRHAFYGLTYPRRNIDSAWGKVYSTYALTDESYVIVSAQPHPQELSGTRLLTIQVYAQVLWVGSGIVGALAGLGIPSDVKGMEFALTALFVVLTYDAFRASPDWSLLAVAGVCGVLAALIFPGQLLMAALIAYFVFVLARHFSPRLDSALRWERGRAAADNVSRETSRSAGEEGAAW